MTFDDMCELEEGTVLWCENTNCPILGKLHFHNGNEPMFQHNSVGWLIRDAHLYSVATDEEAMLYTLENA